MDFLKEIVKEIGDEYTQIASDIDETERFIDPGSYIFNGLISGSILGGVSSNRITAIAGESLLVKLIFHLLSSRTFWTLTLMGIEAVKSSTPAPCRTMIKDVLKLIMTKTEDDVIDFIESCRTKFRSLPPEEISFPRTVSNVKKYKSVNAIYEKGTPIHARGALLFNHYVKKNNLTQKYSLINNGEKIKFCYLKRPNPIQENVISFIQQFPEELNLDKYIDYELQFEKSFLEPLKIILDSIGWESERRVNLESFFV